MPGTSTLFEWLEAHEEFRIKYARARDLQSELGFDDLQEIADDGTNDWMERRNGEGEVVGWQVNGEAIGRSKLRAETLRWRLEKLKPKKYGTKPIELSGPDGGPIQTKDVSDLEIARHLAFLLEAGARAAESEQPSDETPPSTSI